MLNEEDEVLERYNRPLFFYGLSLIIPWILWFVVAYISHQSNQSVFMSVIQPTFGLLGLVSPVLIAAYLFIKDRDLLIDIKGRFLPKKNVSLIYYVITISLIFISLVLSQFISLIFGHGLDQFYISGKPSFTSTVFSPWFILIFAPVVEELAWHTYGTDTIRRKFNLFITSMIFSLYWTLWHLPLSSIKGYYHANVVSEGLIYSGLTPQLRTHS